MGNRDRLRSKASDLAWQAQRSPGEWQEGSPLDGQVRYVDGHFELRRYEHHWDNPPKFFASEPAIVGLSNWWIEQIVDFKNSDVDACRRVCRQFGLDTHELGLD